MQTRQSTLCTSLIGGDRGPGRKMERNPPELLRGGCSLVEYDLTTGGAAGTADTLTALGCRADLVDKYLVIGSRAETLLVVISMCHGL